MVNVNHSDAIRETANNGFNVVDKMKSMTVEQIRHEQPKLPYSVCVMNLHGDLNVANIIRSAVIFAAEKIYVAGRRKYNKCSAVGAFNYIDVELIGNLGPHDVGVDWLSALNKIVADGYTPVFVETGGECIDSTSPMSFKNPCFIFGNEGVGLPQELLTTAAEMSYPVISIRQLGVMRSLNVSVAAGIIMNWYVGQYTLE